jgi:hypothetical protein
MSIQGIIFIDLVALIMILAILNLVRTQKLLAAYATVWILALVGLIVIVSIPPLLAFVTVAVGARFPASALSLLAFMFIIAVLIFFSVQLSIISARQVEMAQVFALAKLAAEEGKELTPKDTEVSNDGAPNQPSQRANR